MNNTEYEYGLSCRKVNYTRHQCHKATHYNIKKNGRVITSIFDQNHKDNHKNSMAGQSIVIDCIRGDEIVIYAYTGTWLADFPMNHYTHWVGILLKPDESEVRTFSLTSSLSHNNFFFSVQHDPEICGGRSRSHCTSAMPARQ